MARITVNNVFIDPERHAPALSAANLISPDSSKSDFILVQTKGPLTDIQKNELKQLDVEILEYVPDDTYICRYQPTDLTKIRALPYVSWANVYLGGFKISPRLLISIPTRAPVDLLSLPPVGNLVSKDTVTVEVVLHKGANMDNVRKAIADAAGVDSSTMSVGRNKVRLTVERRRLKDLAAIDEVRHIEAYIPPKLANNIARNILRADDVQQAGELRGASQVIAICDTGFDKGNTNDVHPAFQGRVLKLYPLGRPTADDPNGHGTHVAGSALGDGMSTVYGKISGMAPAAKLVLQSVLDARGGLGGLPDDLRDLFLPPYRDDGARIHSNSWGAAANGEYTAIASEVDDFVWNHRDMIICIAAGNEGVDSAGRGVIDAGSLNSPGSAKNSVTIGATENHRPDFPSHNQPLLYGQGWPQQYPADPIHSDDVADNAEGMAAFSSRGPAAHNRVKPDLVAPGTAILSTKSRVATGDGWGSSGDALYFFDGGTSMATPIVAGCAAVVREYLQTQNVQQPSAALVKAMLVNGAHLVVGQYVPPEVNNPPDISQGFGRVDLAATVGPYAAGETVKFYDERTPLSAGQEEEIVQDVAANGRDLKVTLVWTDPAGEALQNDLDLIVRTPDGRERHGNMPPGSNDFDRNNNIEQVIWPNVPSGKLSIVVRAYRTVSPQSYALVVRVH